MFQKHLWKSDIWPASLRKRHHPQVFFKYFASKNQLPGFYISGTLVENGLMKEQIENVLSLQENTSTRKESNLLETLNKLIHR